MLLKEFLRDASVSKCGVRAQAICGDGFRLSIQNTPRLHWANENSVEIAMPYRENWLDEIAAYMGDDDTYYHAIYGFVPISNLEHYLAESHGYIKKWKEPQTA